MRECNSLWRAKAVLNVDVLMFLIKTVCFCSNMLAFDPWSWNITKTVYFIILTHIVGEEIWNLLLLQAVKTWKCTFYLFIHYLFLWNIMASWHHYEVAGLYTEKINSFVTLSPLLSYYSVGFLEICFKDDLWPCFLTIKVKCLANLDTRVPQGLVYC